jgi:hypothetical protein
MPNVLYVLATVDTEQPLPHGFNLADLERTATIITWNGERFVWQDEDFRDFRCGQAGPAQPGQLLRRGAGWRVGKVPPLPGA